MKKVYLSPSDQVSNTYCVGDTNEAAQCREICKLTVKALKQRGVEAKTNTTASMKKRVAESDAWGADLHVPVHTNGFNGKADGTLLMCYDLKGEGYKAAKAIFDVLAPLSPGSDYSIQARPDLYEINASNAPCAYVEVAFHDNPIEAQWILDHKPQIAEALAEGICNYLGVAKETPVVKDQFILEIQEALGAPVTGVADSVTLGKTVTLSQYRNRRHKAVEVLQKRLYDLGYTVVGDADGVAGPLFTQAVTAYQHDNGCVDDGEITAKNKTWKKLLGLL